MMTAIAMQFHVHPSAELLEYAALIMVMIRIDKVAGLFVIFFRFLFILTSRLSHNILAHVVCYLDNCVLFLIISKLKFDC